MFLSHAYRMKTCNLKVLSRNFLSFPKRSYHSLKTVEKCFKLLYLPRFVNLKYQNASLIRTFCYQTDEATAFASESDDSPLDNSNVVYGQNLSDDEVKEYREARNITVKGRDVPKPIIKFSELPLSKSLMTALDAENYPEPTPIQSQAWPVALSGRDMIGVSQTGSGKTLAYMLPALTHAKISQKNRKSRMMSAPKVLVLGPTRELVQQIHDVSRRFMEISYLSGACVYGGASRIPQLHNLQGADICIATPGRLLDYIDNANVSLQNCTYLVLDEADRMLDMGFEPQIRAIVDAIHNKRQTLMWSATWPKEIKNLAEDFLTDYIHITVGDTELVANPNITQNIYVVREEEKLDKLYSLLSNVLENKQSKVLVFAETKRNVDILAHNLKRNGFLAWGIHGNCSQSKRDLVLKNFRRTTQSVLIATDVASRGLDITDIDHVVNYDFPTNIEDYIHRIGRTARGSACGESHSFFKQEDSGVLKDLLSVLKKSNQSISSDLLELSEKKYSNYGLKKKYNYYRSDRSSYNRFDRPSYNRSDRSSFNGFDRPSYNRSDRPSYNRSDRSSYNRSDRPSYNRSSDKDEMYM